LPPFFFSRVLHLLFLFFGFGILSGFAVHVSARLSVFFFFFCPRLCLKFPPHQPLLIWTPFCVRPTPTDPPPSIRAFHSPYMCRFVISPASTFPFRGLWLTIFLGGRFVAIFSTILPFPPPPVFWVFIAIFFDHIVLFVLCRLLWVTTDLFRTWLPPHPLKPFFLRRFIV